MAIVFMVLCYVGTLFCLYLDFSIYKGGVKEAICRKGNCVYDFVMGCAGLHAFKITQVPHFDIAVLGGRIEAAFLWVDGQSGDNIHMLNP